MFLQEALLYPRDHELDCEMHVLSLILGYADFLSIVILARVYFTRMETGAEQERVFSTAKRAMGKDQAQMGFEMLQMRTLLCNNKELIRLGILEV